MTTLSFFEMAEYLQNCGFVSYENEYMKIPNLDFTVRKSVERINLCIKNKVDPKKSIVCRAEKYFIFKLYREIAMKKGEF